MSRPHDDDLPARDARFDAAWRQASDEEPPASLDAAIRAAARREVGAGPQRSAPAVPAATRPERWWFPLAAAATIGAIALGLLQLAGPDKLFGGDPSAVVSDIPPGTTTLPRDAPAGTPLPPPVLRPPAAGGITIPPPPSGQGAPRSATPGDAPSPTRPEAKLIRRPFAEPRPESPPAQEAALAPPGKLAAGRIESLPQPALPARAERSPPPATDSAAAAPATPPMTNPPARLLAKSSLPAVEPAAPRLAAPAAAPAPAAALAAQRSREGASAAAPVAADATGRATSPVERRRADTMRDGQDARTPLPVAEWIVLIRKLRDEGKIDEARKELAAFRDAHPDHAQLLPPDLVRWEPAAR